MSQQTITYRLNSNEKNIYSQYLAIVNNVFFYEDLEERKFVPLTIREIEVLSLYMYYNNMYKGLPEKERCEYLNSLSIRNRIKQELGITTSNLNGILLRLKSKYFYPDKTPVFDSGVLTSSLRFDFNNLPKIEFVFFNAKRVQQGNTKSDS